VRYKFIQVQLSSVSEFFAFRSVRCLQCVSWFSKFEVITVSQEERISCVLRETRKWNFFMYLPKHAHLH